MSGNITGQNRKILPTNLREIKFYIFKLSNAEYTGIQGKRDQRPGFEDQLYHLVVI